MTAMVAFFTTTPFQTAWVMTIRETPFQSHHEMRCDHGMTEMHTDPRELTIEDVAVLTMGHQAKTGCNCGTRYEAVARASRPAD